ncbi:cell surface protein [Pedobacter sp. JCM 36344]|uniref:cell surface protein n=1 Tax=Pedobacter sp. JCM 36344 TaxID=3374280 RepID=UPI0039784417
MKIRSRLLVALLGLAIFSACKKDIEDTVLAPSIKMANETAAINGKVNEAITLKANNTLGNQISQEWLVNTELKSNTGLLEFTPAKSGVYTIDYRATNSAGRYTFKYVLTVAVPEVTTTIASNLYVTTLFEFAPSAGQFMNEAGWGNQESGKSIEGKKTTPGISLGAFGGYAVYGFDHTVINQPEKEDVIVYGNAIASLSEPGVVWVMQDENGNRKPDDIWYELAGSEVGKAGYVRDYSVTYTRPIPPTLSVSWKDSKGNTGIVRQSFHKYNHYPLWITADEFTRTGTLLPSDGIKGSISAPLAFGYADNTAGGTDKVDIANAIDKHGKKIVLKGIDFIKVQTGIMADLSILGELSTEVTGIADISLIK